MRVILVSSSSGSDLTQLATQINKDLCLVFARSNCKIATWGWCSVVKIHFLFCQGRCNFSSRYSERGENGSRKIISFLCWSVSLLLSCVQLPGSNLAQAVETKKKSSLNGWQGSMCHPSAVSGQYLVHIIKMSLCLAQSDIALEYEQIICGLVWHEGYANHSQLEIVPPSPFWIFPWCQMRNAKKSIACCTRGLRGDFSLSLPCYQQTHSWAIYGRQKSRYEGRYH